MYYRVWIENWEAIFYEAARYGVSRRWDINSYFIISRYRRIYVSGDIENHLTCLEFTLWRMVDEQVQNIK